MTKVTAILDLILKGKNKLVNGEVQVLEHY